jgi:glycogen operon protein
MTIAGFNGEEDLHIMLNMYWERLTFEVPLLENRGWYRAVSTAAPSPLDIAEPGSELPVEEDSYLVPALSIVILVSK